MPIYFKRWSAWETKPKPQNKIRRLLKLCVLSNAALFAVYLYLCRGDTWSSIHGGPSPSKILDNPGDSLTRERDEVNALDSSKARRRYLVRNDISNTPWNEKPRHDAIQPVCPGSLTSIRSSSKWLQLRYLPHVPLFLTLDNVYASLSSDYPPYGIKGESVDGMKKLLRMLPAKDSPTESWLPTEDMTQGKQCIHCVLTRESYSPTPRRHSADGRHVHYRFVVARLPSSLADEPRRRWRANFVVVNADDMAKLNSAELEINEALRIPETVILIFVAQSRNDYERLRQWTRQRRFMVTGSKGAPVLISEVRIVHPEFVRYVQELFIENVIGLPSKEFIASILAFHICDYVRIRGNFLNAETGDYFGSSHALIGSENRDLVEQKIFDKMDGEGAILRDA